MSFKEQFLYSLYTRWGRFDSAPFNLSDIRMRPGRLLICLPSDPLEAREAAFIIPDLISCLRAEAVFVVGELLSVECCDPADGPICLVPLDQEARRWSGLPSAEIVDRLAKEDLNLAIDLNPRPELFSSALCLRINAPIRMCLDDPLRRRFFNLHLAFSDTDSPHDESRETSNSPDTGQPDASGTTPPGTSSASPYARALRMIRRVTRPPAGQPNTT